MSNVNTIQALQNQKSNGVCILLFFFLGCFGAHRFYSYGLTGFNIAYLFTLGFMGFGVIIDLFLVWGMADKANMNNLMNAQVLDSVTKA